MANSPRSSASSAGLIEARLRRSRLLQAAQVGLHVAAALPAFLLPLPLYASAGWLLILSGCCGWRLLRPPVTSIRQLPDGGWRLAVAERRIDAELRDWYAHPWFCVVLFRAGRRFRRAVAIPCWTVAPDVHRRLRAVLRSSSESRQGERNYR